MFRYSCKSTHRSSLVGILLILSLTSAGCSNSSTVSGAGSEEVINEKQESNGIAIEVSDATLAAKLNEAINISGLSNRYINRIKNGSVTGYISGSKTMQINNSYSRQTTLYIASVLIHEQCHAANGHSTVSVTNETVCLREQGQWLRSRGATHLAVQVEQQIGTHGLS